MTGLLLLNGLAETNGILKTIKFCDLRILRPPPAHNPPLLSAYDFSRSIKIRRFSGLFIPNGFPRWAHIDPQRHRNPGITRPHGDIHAIPFSEKPIFGRLHDFNHVAVIHPQHDALTFLPCRRFLYGLPHDSSRGSTHRPRDNATGIVASAGRSRPTGAANGASPHGAEVGFVAFNRYRRNTNDGALTKGGSDPDLGLRNKGFARGKRATTPEESRTAQADVTDKRCIFHSKGAGPSPATRAPKKMFLTLCPDFCPTTAAANLSTPKPCCLRAPPRPPLMAPRRRSRPLPSP